MTKQSSTKEILGVDILTYRNRIQWQLTPEMNWTNIEIDHVRPICIFDVSKEEELRDAFIRKNTQPLLKEAHQRKGIKNKFFRLSITIYKSISVFIIK